MPDKGIDRGTVVVLFVVGLLVFGTGVYRLILSHASNVWPEVDARVIVSSVEERFDAESTTFNPVVRYEYVVDHVRYLGDGVEVSQRIFVNSRENAEKVVQKYPLGAEVKVFYNPSNPAYAVLEPGMGHNAPVQAGIGLLLIMIGLSVWRHAKRGQEAVL